MAEVIAELKDRDKHPDDMTAHAPTTGIVTVTRMGSASAWQNRPMEAHEATKAIAKNLRKLLATTPEFAIHSSLYMNSEGKLVFRDGYTLTFDPAVFGVDPASLSSGQSVHIPLEEYGIKPAMYIRRAEAIAKKGFPKTKAGKVEIETSLSSVHRWPDSPKEAADRARLDKLTPKQLHKEAEGLGVEQKPFTGKPNPALRRALRLQLINEMVDAIALQRQQARAAEIDAPPAEGGEA